MNSKVSRPKLVPVAVLALVTMYVSNSSAIGDDKPEKIPIGLRHLGYERDELFNVHSFKLTLSNENDKPRWFLLPGSGDEPRPKIVVFRNDPNKPRSIDTDRPPSLLLYDGKRGMVAIGVGYFGFSAVRLPAGCVFEMSDYGLLTHRSKTTDFTYTVFDEAEELLVNGKVSLEKWIPFDVGVFKEDKLPSGLGTKATKEAVKANAAVENEKAHPREKVEYIEAKGLHRWTVKFQNIGDRR